MVSFDIGTCSQYEQTIRSHLFEPVIMLILHEKTWNYKIFQQYFFSKNIALEN